MVKSNPSAASHLKTLAVLFGSKATAGGLALFDRGMDQAQLQADGQPHSQQDIRYRLRSEHRPTLGHEGASC